MSDQAVIVLIQSVTAIVLGAIGVWGIIEGRRRRATLIEVEDKLDKNTKLTVSAQQCASVAATAAVASADDVKEAVNGRMQQLLDLKYAEGVIAGQASLKELQAQQHRHHQANLDHIRRLEEAIEEIKRTRAQSERGDAP